MVVTGAAGFIGSQLAERLLELGHDVLGVDCLVPYYPLSAKRSSLDPLLGHARFRFSDADLRTDDVDPLLDSCDVVFHLAGQPGVRPSWSQGFADYLEHNVAATNRVLDAARRRAVGRVVFASSSSVYGNAPRYPTREDDLPRPFSPYGVTKLAAEHLCGAYARNWGLHTVSLRYFTVYGPRQRPDMAIHRLVEAVLGGDPFVLYGDGSARRDFTYVGDVVEATVLAATADVALGTVLNVAGGSSVTIAELVALVEDLAGREVPLERRAPQPGDVAATGGSIDAAAHLLGWRPATLLAEGVKAQLEWHQTRRSTP